jgi:mRNA-degrading endonuclease RelE of RelBE toxin-antitoxin system
MNTELLKAQTRPIVYSLEIEEEVSKTFRKPKEKQGAARSINKKILQILSDPTQFKPLKYPLDGLRRAYIGSFVIIYRIIENPATIQIIKYAHHDQAYL